MEVVIQINHKLMKIFNLENVKNSRGYINWTLMIKTKIEDNNLYTSQNKDNASSHNFWQPKQCIKVHWYKSYDKTTKKRLPVWRQSWIDNHLMKTEGTMAERV